MTTVMAPGQRVKNEEKRKIINPDGNLHKLASPQIRDSLVKTLDRIQPKTEQA